MQYRKDKYGQDLSILGYGCMRFTRKGNGIDLDKAEQELLAAMRAGVNYFDTAYIYPGSEAALGEILERNHCRDQVNIATKLPQYLIQSSAAFEKHFQEQLSRLRTDHIDYYLMHMLTAPNSWRKMESLGIKDWIEEKKASGAIRNIGFSFHGSTALFLELLEVYDWDFCQIQYNYMDEHAQAGREGLQAAAAKGIPVIIMEPLRGGKLVDLMPAEGKRCIAKDAHGWSAAEWAFRWLWDQPEVTCVLSGMNSLAMVEENCRIADTALPHRFGEAEFALIDRLKEELTRNIKVGCTGCGYCMPCPQGVDIPGAFRCYNQMYTERKSSGRKEYWQTVALRKEAAFARQCIGCGACERHCPQHLPIRELLKEADKALCPLPYRVGAAVTRKYLFG